MPEPTESTSLLGDPFDSNSVLNQPRYLASEDALTEQTADDDLEEEDREVDLVMTRFGSPGGHLGLGGGTALFSSSLLSHRSSLVFSNEPTLNRVRSLSESLRQRSPSPSIFSNGSIRETRRRTSLPKKSTTTNALQEQSTIQEETEPVEDDVGHGKITKYKYGVSEARFWGAFITIVLVWFVGAFDGTLMASSHPVITSYFDSSNLASWLSTSFLLTSTAFQPMFARLSDSFGRRPLFLIPLAAFGLGTLWCALAPTIISFILARAVCGLGASGTIALGAIIVSDLVELHHRASYLSILNMSFAVGSALGAALGGFLADTIGWRWEFGVQVPAFIVSFIVACFTVPSELGPCLAKTTNTTVWQNIRQFDLAGSFLLTASVGLLILALSLGGNIYPWSHPLVLTSLILSVVLVALLLYIESKIEKPVLPVHLVFHIPRGNILFADFLNCMTINTVLFNVPLYFQATLLDTPTRSGTRLIVAFIASMAASFSTGNLITWTARLKPWHVLGFALMLVGSLLLSTMQRSAPTWSYSATVSVSMIGQGIGFPTATMAMLAVSSVDDMAVATATQMLFRSLGSVMGVSVSSLVLQNFLPIYLDKYVSGPDRTSVIDDARKSVELISTFAPRYREQVIDAYARSLHYTFAQGAITCAIALTLVVSIRLPRLSTKSLGGADLNAPGH